MKNFFALTLITASLLFIACGSDDNDPGEDKKAETEALLTGDWNLDASSDISNYTIQEGDGATLTPTGFTSKGNIANFVSGGTWSVDDEGLIMSATVDVNSTEVQLTGDVSVTLNEGDKITISFSTEEVSSRTNGLGEVMLVLVK